MDISSMEIETLERKDLGDFSLLSFVPRTSDNCSSLVVQPPQVSLTVAWTDLENDQNQMFHWAKVIL